MKWSMGNPSQSSDHAMTSSDQRKVKLVTSDHTTIRAQYIRKQLEMQFSNNR